MVSISQQLRTQIQKTYEESMNSIEVKIEKYDAIKKIGELWVQRGYYRTYKMDRSYPYHLTLKTGPQELYLCPIINPFIEELEDMGHLLGSAKIENDIVEIPIRKPNNSWEWHKYGTIFFVPAQPKVCIRKEETEQVSVTTKVTKSSMIC